MPIKQKKRNNIDGAKIQAEILILVCVCNSCSGLLCTVAAALVHACEISTTLQPWVTIFFYSIMPPDWNLCEQRQDNWKFKGKCQNF